MKLKMFIKDKLYVLLIAGVCYILSLLFYFAFKLNITLIIALSLLFWIMIVLLIFWDFFRKKNFYQKLFQNITYLPQSYLVLETLVKPNFYEGKLLWNALYEINKSMIENVKELEEQKEDFQNYIEMWIHEVKIPLAVLILTIHNHPTKDNQKLLKELSKIENYVEQVLYYSRSRNSEKDYVIKEVNLSKVFNNVALKNQSVLLENSIDLIVHEMDLTVYSDSKWLEFAINQVINNSIKYRRKNINSYIKVSGVQDEKTTKLIIEDNGIGIRKEDINRVFDKSFTGVNGRLISSSTGFGLFITKSLLNKLGHEIMIESKENVYTKVTIVFSKNKYFEVLK